MRFPAFSRRLKKNLELAEITAYRASQIVAARWGVNERGWREQLYRALRGERILSSLELIQLGDALEDIPVGDLLPEPWELDGYLTPASSSKHD